MSDAVLRFIDRLPATDVPHEPLAFLRDLGGPVAIRREGRDRSRSRVLVTLLHGNEPSGFLAVHSWLREARRPATDVLVVLGGVDAALAAPQLGRRLLPDGTDLNRCFPSRTELRAGTLAHSIVEAVAEARPEALVDIHNNTGHNPAYAVVTRQCIAELRLAGLFARRLVDYDLRLGALIETTAGLCPSIVVEVGRAGDSTADRVAKRGVARFLEEGDILEGARPPALEVFSSPVRVEVAPAMTVAFGDTARDGADLTVDQEIDRHNFETIAPGTTIGWARPGSGWPLVAFGADRRERSRELFILDGDKVSASRELVPIMMTTDAGVARSDCLFYVVEAAGPGGSIPPTPASERPA